jgi:hypothetical protein
MMTTKFFLYGIALIVPFLQVAAMAQSPKYVKISPRGPRSNLNANVIYGYPMDSVLPRRFHCIYSPKYFSPKPPGGYIKSIYYNVVAGQAAAPNGVLYDVEIKMGYTQRDSFKLVDKTQARYARDTFIIGLTTVFRSDSLVLDHRGKYGASWVKVPLMSPGFYFSGGTESNIVVELSFGNNPFVKNAVAFSDSMSNEPRRTLAGYRDSIDVAIHRTTEIMVGSNYGSIDFGFDLTPTAVKEPTITVGELYPNPASSILYLPIVDAKGNVTVTIHTLDGKEVSAQNYILSGGQKTIILRVKELPAGNYIIGIGTGNDHLSRKFTKL